LNTIINLFIGEFIRPKKTRRINSPLHLSLCCLGISVANISFSQSAHKHLREGDAAYLRKDYKKAELDYRNAQEAERSYKGSFNLGNSLYMQQRHDDALQIYADVAKRGIDNEMRSQAFYNQGNTHIVKNDYDKAIEAYKQSLRLNPNDEDAKKNLAFAKKMQKEQQKKQQNQDKNQQQQPQNQDKNQQQQNQQQNQDKNQQQQPPQNQPQNQDKNPQQNQQQPNQQQPQNMSKDNAERLLQIMDNEDQKVQQRLKKGKPSKKRPSTKDW
jgi:Ca-activated chloride channel homolog